jgi:hypothetical protein
MKAILIALLIGIISSRDVYMCHDDPFKDEQCLKTETFGRNTFYWLRKCKGAKVCVELPYYGDIGACSIKVRSHYDGESCANGNKCTSGICDGTKCKGLNPGVKCQRGLGQGKKVYLCRTSTEMPGYTCQPPIGNGETCSSTRMDYSNLLNTDFYPATNPCNLGYVCSYSDNAPTTSKCIEIGSQSTTASNPLACKTGVSDGTTCKTLPSNSSCTTTDTNYLAQKTTSKGAQFCLSNDITTEFENWLKEIGKNKLKDKDANYEAYRYTRNKKKINEAFFRYTHYGWISDADECAYDYKWKQNNGNYLKLSFMLLVLVLIL